MKISESLDDTKKLAARLYRDFHAMKTYGKEPESLHSIISLFNETLAEYSFVEINHAMQNHAKESAEFPTPFDVIEQIKKLRKLKSYQENRIVIGVDDQKENLLKYQEKKQKGERLTPREITALREYGWKI